MKNLPLPEYPNPEPRFKWCTSIPELILELEQHDMIAIDTETYYDPLNQGVIRFIGDSKNNSPFGLSVTYCEGEDSYVSYWVLGEDNIRAMRPILENKDIAKILHNSKYDMHMLKNIGLTVEGYIWDTMIMIHLIDEEHMCRTPEGKEVMSKSLKNLAYHYLGEDGHLYEDLVSEVRRVLALNSGRLKSAVSYKEASDAAPEIMKDYACSDTEFTFRLFKKLMPELLRQDLTGAYTKDIQATHAVFEMERVGLGIDIEYFTALQVQLTKKSEELMDEILTIIPVELNIRSSRDLVEAFGKLGVEWVWFTDKGEPQTDSNVLKRITEGEAGRLASLVLEYRDTTKVLDTFVAQMFTYNQNGSIHADFNISPRDDSGGGTVTGRLSSNNPNLHNLPKDDDRIRKGIVPRPGYVFVEMDYDFETLVVVKAH